MRMRHVASRQFLYFALVALIAMQVAALPVSAQSRLTDENWFDVKVLLRFDDGELVSPGGNFSIQREGTWVDIELRVDAAYLVAEIDFVFLKLNGVTVLFNPGTYRAELAEHGNELAIEAYGEAFVSTHDAQYRDQVSGTITWTNPEPLILWLSLAVIGVVFLMVWIGKRFLR
ncbi:MAG: hypothetical protein ACW99U_02580 [Candidatus Thorarchaeota archaeon]|jgi:hypothetical protein